MSIVDRIRKLCRRNSGDPDDVLDRIARHRAERDVAANGYVRGWHGGCPASERPMLGTYALVPDGAGGVMCEACGTRDLVPRAEAQDAVARLDATGVRS